MKNLRSLGMASWMLLFVAAVSVRAEIVGLERVASSLNSPVYATHAPGDQDRLFIVERGGAIKILDLNNNSLIGDFLTIPDVDAAGEGGLLGLAFHPEYATNGKFYVYVTVDNGGLDFQGATSPFSSRIRQYTVSANNPNVADSAPTEILSWIQPQANHNGGWIGFNPKTTPDQPQYLHITSGDGGGANDLGNGHTPSIGNAQDLTDNLHGKILRIDIDGDDFPGDANRNYANPSDNPFVNISGDDEIWSYGLRNPWRASFDRETGDFWLGDVGQNALEEINFLPADSTGGENFGWRLREGEDATPTGGVGGPLPGAIDPVYQYDNSDDLSLPFAGNSVVGGILYRGPDPDVQGRYLFADSRTTSFTNANYWQFDPSDPGGSVQNINDSLVPDAGSRGFPVAFGEDAVGNVYVVDLGGDLFRIVTNNLVPGDYNGDGIVSGADYDVWKSNFGSLSDLAADGNGNNIVDAADYTIWRDNLGTSASGFATTNLATNIPEPSTALLLALAFMGCFVVSRRR